MRMSKQETHPDGLSWRFSHYYGSQGFAAPKERSALIHAVESRQFAGLIFLGEPAALLKTPAVQQESLPKVVVGRMPGMRFVWGGQFGWGHFEPLLKEENRDLLDYFTALCRLRTDYARVFCRGEFLRPPALTNTATGDAITNPLTGPLLAAMWGDPEADRALVFLVNVTRRDVEADVVIPDFGWQMARQEGNIRGVAVLPDRRKGQPHFRVRMPPLTSLAVLLTRSEP